MGEPPYGEMFDAILDGEAEAAERLAPEALDAGLEPLVVVEHGYTAAAVDVTCGYPAS